VQLDKTAIVNSHRSGINLVDLSLIVMRRYWRSITLFSVLGTIPFALINLVLLWPLTQYDLLLISSEDSATSQFFHFRYLSIATAVVLIQAPLAMCAVTYFIGRAVFIESPTVGQVAASVWERKGALIFFLGGFRMSLLVFLPMLFLFRDPTFRPEIELPLYLFIMCGYVYFLRGTRPFAAEILLLEKCPVFKSKERPNQLSYSQRSKWLHSGLYVDSFLMHIGITNVAVLTALSLSLGIVFLTGVVVGSWRWGLWMDLVLYPLVLWSVATWCTVIRFLSYMNSRIRTEGWEIELRLKAEAQRIEGANP